MIILDIPPSQCIQHHTTVTDCLCGPDKPPSWILGKTINMPKSKKEKPLIYYNKYDYSNSIQVFTESDRITENELESLECYNTHQVERTLNSLDDHTINDYLYKIYYSDKPSTKTLMQRWISYFVNQHKNQLFTKVKSYLEPKKLTMDEWLRGVSEGRRGDILSIYVLSIATGVHTMVHLRNHRIWSTLQDAPTSHEALLERCDKHLISLGFGIFLRLVKRNPVVIGTLSSDDPVTQQKLITKARLHPLITLGATGMTPGTALEHEEVKKNPVPQPGRSP